MRKTIFSTISPVLFFSLTAMLIWIVPCSADQSYYVDAEQDRDAEQDWSLEQDRDAEQDWSLEQGRDADLRRFFPDAQDGEIGAMDAVVPEALPNLDDYQIVFSDRFGDTFYLNEKDVKRSSRYFLYLYRGKWNCSHGTADVMAMYYKNVSTLTVTATYRGKYIMTYQMKKASDTHMDGYYTWLNSPYSADKYLLINSINLTKGQFGQ